MISSLDRRISNTGPGYLTKFATTCKSENSLTVEATKLSAKLGILGIANGTRSSKVASSI